MKEGTEQGGKAITPVTAKEPFAVRPVNAKEPVSFGSGKLGGGTDKPTPAADEGWREKQYWNGRPA